MFSTILILTLTYFGGAFANCHIFGITECNSFELVKDLRFHGFIPKDKFQDYCRDMRVVLDCVYLKKYVDQCTIAETFFYDAQRDVSNTVCGDPDEYIKHVDCLGNPSLEDKLTKDCLSFLSEDEINCDLVDHARTCITSLILGQCGQKDVEYMDLLAYKFLTPISQTKSCVLVRPVMWKTDPVTTTKVSTNVTDTTAKDTNTTMSTTQTTPMTTPSLASQRTPATLMTMTLATAAIFVVWFWNSPS